MGLRPDIPCKKHKNGSIELYATIANTKRGCAYFDTPSNVYKYFQSGTSVPSSLLFCIPYFFFSDYKSLYSMMPDFKSGITFS